MGLKTYGIFSIGGVKIFEEIFPGILNEEQFVQKHLPPPSPLGDGLR